MNCPSCGTDNPAGNRFCNNCGSELSAACPNCRSSNTPGSQFCGQCGTSLGGLAVPAPAGAAEAPEVSERRLVTVLFADLVGFTTLSEDRDSEDVRALLTDYFDRCREAVERFGGVVDKFIGDAVTAVWGAVTANEDDAERAVRAGLELVDVVGKLGADQGIPELALRVGILTGEASVGPGGNQMGLVAGDMVNTASRLQSIADGGTVLVGESTYRAAQQAISFEPIGEQAVKGKAVPVEAWRALRVIAERGGRGRAEVLEPPFVGRRDELRLLKDMLDSVGRDQRARLVSVVGEGGIGKSRLVWEFLKYIDGLVETIYWHEGRSPSYGDGVTFWAAAEMIRSRAGVAETDTAAETKRALRECLQKYVEDEDDRAWIEPRLSAVLGLSDAPSGDRAELDAAVRAFFEAIARRGTTALVFEDLHWADSALLDFVEELTDWSRNYPILVVTLARPDLLERRPTWGAGKHGFVSMNLGPLTEVEMTDLVEGMVPGIGVGAAEPIVEKAAGVPLYAVEMVRMLLAAGDLEEVDGVYRVAGDLSDLSVPESLQAVIGARLDRLESADRSLIQDAAVLGHAFTLAGLASIRGFNPDQAERQVAELVRRELIEPVRDVRSPERGQYRFVQGLIREVALARMSRDSRKDRHLKAASYYEGMDDPEVAVIVATHYLEAYRATPEGKEADELRAKAIGTLERAVERAASLRSSQQVVTTSEQALELAENDDEKAIFWDYMVDALTRLARHDEAEEIGQRALTHAQRHGSTADEDRLMRVLAFAHTEAGDYTKTAKLLAGYLEGRDDLDSSDDLAAAAGIYARALMLGESDQREAIEAAERALQAAERRRLVPIIVDTLITRGTAIGFAGRHLEAQILLEGAVELADQHDLAHAAMRGRNNVAITLSYIRPEVAVLASEEAFEIARRVGNISQYLFMAGNLLGWYSLGCRFEAMDKLLADPLLEDMPDRYRISVLRFQAYAAAARGDLAKSRALIEETQPLIGDDPELITGMGFAAIELGVRMVEGELAEAFAGFFNLIETHDWLGITNAGWGAFICAALSGDRGMVDPLLTEYQRHKGQLGRDIRYLEALQGLDGGDLEAAVVARSAIDEYEAIEWPQQAIAARVGLVHFLPEDHPDRRPLVEEALARCDELGIAGFKRLVEQQAPSVM